MTFSGLLDAVQASELSQRIAATNHFVTAGLQVVHVLGFVLMLASWVLIALRVNGVVFANSGVRPIVRDAHRLILLGLACAVVTGTIMVIGAPHHYFSNQAFQLKLILFISAALVQLATITYLSRPAASMAFIRIGVSASAVLWFGVSVAGRAIGFV